MGITKGKGFAGALGSMRDMNYGYVPLPYKEMMTGNLMRQQSYDKSQATIDEMGALYDDTFIEKDSAILNQQEADLDASISEMIEGAGGDLGKLTGAFTNLYRKTASNKTLRNATAQKANRTAFSEELRKAKLDQGMAQFYLDKADDAYVGADKGQYNGVSYSNLKQNDIYKNLVTAAGKVDAQTISRQEAGYMYGNEFYSNEYLTSQGIDGATRDEFTETTRTVKTTTRDPKLVQEKINGVLGANPSWVQSMSDYSEANGMDFQEYAGGMTSNISDLFEKGNQDVGKGTAVPTSTEPKKGYVPLSLSGPTVNVPTEQFMVGRDENGNKMEGLNAVGKVSQLMNPSINTPLDVLSSERSLWMLALENAEETRKAKYTAEDFKPAEAEKKPSAQEFYDSEHGTGSYKKLMRVTTFKEQAGVSAAIMAGYKSKNSKVDAEIMAAMDEVLKDATIALNYDLLDESVTSKKTNHVIKSLSLAANTDFEGLGMQLLTVNNKGDDEGSREPTDEENMGNMTDININQFSKRPIYDAQKGITGYRIKGTFEGVDENIHTFEAVIPTNNPLLPQIYQGAGLPPLSGTMNSLGKLMVRDQVVIPPKLAAIGEVNKTNLGVYAHPGGGYYIVELNNSFRPEVDGKGNLITAGHEVGEDPKFRSLNEIAQYIEEEHSKMK